jgi:hypothetical protein
VGGGKPPCPLSRLEVPSALLRALVVRHPVLARVPFLLDSPPDPLAAALQVRPLSPSQERQRRTVVRPGHAPSGTPPLFQRRSNPLYRPPRIPSISCSTPSIPRSRLPAAIMGSRGRSSMGNFPPAPISTTCTTAISTATMARQPSRWTGSSEPSATPCSKKPPGSQKSERRRARRMANNDHA